jgi:hypothetical protein
MQCVALIVSLSTAAVIGSMYDALLRSKAAVLKGTIQETPCM